jgi:hypothetical protein
MIFQPAIVDYLIIIVYFVFVVLIGLLLRSGKRPFLEISLPNKSEYPVGQLLQFKMIETVYLKHLLDV